MSRTFSSSRHKALVAFLKKKRKEARLTQYEVAERLDRWQSFVTAYEKGQKRIDVVELVELSEAIGFDPVEAVQLVKKIK